MSTREEQNKAIVRRFYEAFEADDAASLGELLAPDLVARSHGSADPQGLAEHLEGIRMWNAAFQTRFTIEEQIAEGDKVASRVTMQAVHSRGEFQGLAPTGATATSGAVSIERLRDGKIVERRVQSDWLGLMQQVGLMPAPTATRASG